MKFLFIANDEWFDVDSFVTDNETGFFWPQRLNRLSCGDSVYFYLSGKTKAIKYEFTVLAVNLPLATVTPTYYKSYYNSKSASRETTVNKLCQLKLKRTLHDLAATSPKSLRDEAKILGRLMSQRMLSPYACAYLDALK